MKNLSAMITLLLVIVSFACGKDTTDQNKVQPKQITFAGIGDHGIFDPSLAKDPASSRIWMSYSEVDDYPYNPLNSAINTRLAYSDNSGANWSDSGVVANQSSPLGLTAPQNLVNWQYEVSSICYDSGAPVAERWKMMFHRYLCLDGNRLFQHGWIGLRTASAPDGTWSAERKLFVGNIYDPIDDPIIGVPEVVLDGLHADLSGCVAFSEPGLLATDTALYCCMLGAEGLSTNGRIILLKYPHATNTWEYCGTFILNSTDGPSLGYDGFSAPSFFKKDDKYYLMATPQIADKYLGTYVFKITDLDTATLKRDNGVLVVEKTIYGRPGSHNGAAGYIPEANASGVIYSDVMVNDPLDFRMYESYINPIIQNPWLEHSANPLIDSEWSNWYDLIINDPCVIKEGSTYRMWFSQGTGLGVNHVKIYHGTSLDGINWNLDRSTVLLESNSDAEATGSPTPSVTGTYVLVGEGITDLVNDKPAFKHATLSWHLWYDPSATNYRISEISGDAGGRGWLGNGGTKVDGNYTAYGIGTSGTVSIASDWDSEKIETPMVIKVGSTFHMYYSGFKIGDGPGKYKIGHATSPDGLAPWTKDTANNPVVAYHDNPNNWGYYLVAEPAVIYENGTFYLYYTSIKQRVGYTGNFAGIQGICLSTSPDGSVFTFQQAVLTQSSNYPVSGKYVGYSTPYIMKDSDNKYHMFYDVAAYPEVDSWRQVALAHAVSDNYVNFTEIEHDIFVNGQGDWKDHEVRSPSVLEEDGYFKMWFAGNNSLFWTTDFIFAIGYATAEK